MNRMDEDFGGGGLKRNGSENRFQSYKKPLGSLAMHGQSAAKPIGGHIPSALQGHYDALY